jgi:hypothetical protein
MEEVAELMRANGFPVVGDDVAFLAEHGVVLDFPPADPGAEEVNAAEGEAADDDEPTTDSRPESLLYLVGFNPPVLRIVSEPEYYAGRIDLRHGSRRPFRQNLLGRLTRKLLRRDRIRRLKVYR